MSFSEAAKLNAIKNDKSLQDKNDPVYLLEREKEINEMHLDLIKRLIEDLKIEDTTKIFSKELRNEEISYKEEFTNKKSGEEREEEKD